MIRFTRLAVAFVLLILAESIRLGVVGAEPLSHNLIQLNTRVFDLRTDVSALRRESYFIPVTRVKWLAAYLARDSVMYQAVFHIREHPQPVTRPWTFPGPGGVYIYDQGIPEVLQIDGYEVRTSHPTEHVGLFYLPHMPEPDHSFTCHRGGSATLCVVVAKYPPDDHIYLMSRIYRPYELDDWSTAFKAIADRMREVAYCLDVTKAVRARQDGTLPEPLEPFGPDFDLSSCRVPEIS